jgi:diguanylate cyclase (GGDEF)-like protein/PAS domain S-box-containing protein
MLNDMEKIEGVASIPHISLAAVADLNPSPTVVTHVRAADSPIAYVNRAFELLTGYSSHELVGKSLSLLLGSDGDQPGIDRLRSALSGSEPLRVILQNYRRDGEIFFNEMAVSPIRNDQGAITHYVAICQDVTAHVKNQDLVLTAKREHSTILNASPAAIYAHDRNGIVTIWNPAAERIFGFSAQDVIGNVLPIVRPETKEQFDSIRRRVFAGETIEMVDLTQHHKDGKELHIQLSTAPVRDVNGAVIGQISILNDVTHDRNATAALRQQLEFTKNLIDAIPAPIYYKNRNGEYQGFNRAWESFFGRTRDETQGKTVDSLFDPELAKFHREWDQALYAGTGPAAGEVTVPTADGSARQVVYYKSLYNGEDESEGGIIGVINDITDLRNVQRRLDLALENSAIALWDWDIANDKITFSETWATFMGVQPAQLTLSRTELCALREGEPRPEINDALMNMLKGITLGFRIEQPVRTNTDAVKWMLSQGKVIERDSTGKAIRAIGTTIDITDRKNYEEALRTNEEQFRLITENVSDLIAMVDVTGKRIYNSPSYRALFGDDVLVPGSNSFDQIHPDDRAAVINTFQASLKTGVGHRARFRFQLEDGSVRYIESQGSTIRAANGEVDRVVIVSRDITDRLDSEERLKYLALYDHLTGLPNRVLLQERLQRAIERAAPVSALVAVLFLDLDDFKTINDSLGHAAGDLFLKTCADRIRSCLRESDTLARQGGDEFIIVLEDIETPEQANLIARRISDQLCQPQQLFTQEVAVSAAIGVSYYPLDGTTDEELLRNADAAMYQAKSEGKSSIRRFTNAMNVAIREKIELDRSLRRAIDREEFVMYYQVRTHAANGEVSGAEALIRWNHPTLGLVGPNHFIGHSEESGLIVPIGKWIMDRVCKETRSWVVGAPSLRRVSINVSARQLCSNTFINDIDETLRRWSFPAECLELELTESSIMERPEEASKIFEVLRQMKINVAIDDFGTGYSSLGYLKRFGVDRLKIDRTFVRDITTDANDAAIVKAVIAMAKSLGLVVTAEGVETPEQRDFLIGQSCDELQGYLIGKPVPLDKLLADYPIGENTIPNKIAKISSRRNHVVSQPGIKISTAV